MCDNSCSNDICDENKYVTIKTFFSSYFINLSSSSNTKNIATYDEVLCANLKNFSGVYQVLKNNKLIFINIDHNHCVTPIKCDKTSCQYLILNPDLSISNVLSNVLKFITQQWYYSNTDSDVRWTPVDYFLNFNELIASGISTNVLDTGNFTRYVLQQLINYYSTQPDSLMQSFTQVLNELYQDLNLGTYFQFPFVTTSSNDPNFITINVPYKTSCSSLFKNTFQLQKYLANFYKNEQLGMVIGIDGIPKRLVDPVPNNLNGVSTNKAIIDSKNSVTYNILKVDIKLSFMAMLRCLVDPVKNINLLNMNESDYNKVKIDTLPALITNNSRRH